MSSSTWTVPRRRCHLGPVRLLVRLEGAPHDARIRDRRIERNLSQEGLAELVGAGRRTVVRIELGITSPPIDRLLFIARVLGIPPAELMPQAQDEG